MGNHVIEDVGANPEQPEDNEDNNDEDIGANPEQPEDNNDNGEDKTEGGGLTKPIASRPPKEGEIAINSAEKLAKIGTTEEYPLDGKYILTSDIDLSGYSEGKGWTPIGTSSSIFTGSFNGNGYNITGLIINRPTEKYAGLFGYTSEATIENAALEDINVTGREHAGGLVGGADESTNISNSYATGSVTGKDNVGGLVGFTDNSSTIENSYATGSVTGAWYVGGLLGYADWGTEISNSYATGSVEGTNDVGGLVGSAGSSTITNSYATGSVNGTENRVGGLMGRALFSTINNSYWDTQTTGQTKSSGGGTGKTTDDMKKKETYSGWNFESLWKIEEGEYPTLINNPER